MIFWILVFGLTALIIALVLRPLTRSAQTSVDALAHDREVYKDQLLEIERDLENGLLSDDEAVLARVEISRRLISADEKVSSKSAIGKISVPWLLPVIVIIPAVALGVYIYVGTPMSPDLPLALRTAPALTQTAQAGVPNDLAEMVAQAEAHLTQNPNDGRGWDVLAPVYFRMGQYLKSQIAFAKAIEFEGSTALRHAGLGEAIVSTLEGQVTAEARSNFARALEIQPNAPRPHFFLALGLAQDGKRDEAIAAFETLAKASPADAPWINAVRGQVAQLKGIEVNAVQLDTAPASTNALALLPPSNTPSSTSLATPLGNPTQEDIAAAGEMETGDRMDMIRTMVASLDEKLIDEPNNYEGWQRLLQSYTVLGDKDAASLALKRALTAFAPDTDQGLALIAQAKQLGIKLPSEVE